MDACETKSDVHNASVNTVSVLSKSLNAATVDDGSGEVEKNKSCTKIAKGKRRHTLTGSSVDAELRLKRRKINVAGAPKLPLNGYMRYMNDRRDHLRREFPNKTSLEITRIIAEEWQTLPPERKRPYLQEAFNEKQRYLDNLNQFLKEHPEVLASEMAKEKPASKKANSKEKLPIITATTATNNTNNNNSNNNNNNIGNNDNTNTNTKKSTNNIKIEKPAIQQAEEELDELPLTAMMKFSERGGKCRRTPTPTRNNIANNNHTNTFTINGGGATTNQNVFISGEIPIYTVEFLEHNRNLDLEFRTLRKQRSDLEQRNSVLDKHVENTSTGLTKINRETDEIKEQNRHLTAYLEHLKQKLIASFSTLPISSEPNGANAENIMKYMDDLYNMVTTNTHAPCLNKARDIIRKLELSVRTKF